MTIRSQAGSKTPWAQLLEAKSPNNIVSAQHADNKINNVLQWLNDSPEGHGEIFPTWMRKSKHTVQTGTVWRYKTEFFIAAASMKLQVLSN